jgi:acetylornithine deacetylase
VFNAAGIPCVVFGPGDIAQAHTSEEWIDIGNLQAAASVILRLITGQ